MTLPQLIAWCAVASDESALPPRFEPSRRPRPEVADPSSAEAESAPLIAPGDERALFERVCAGDDRAFQEIYHVLYLPLRAFAYALMRDDGAAHDAVQEVLFAFWQHRGRLDARERFVPYLYKAVRNQAAKYVRHERVIHRVEAIQVPGVPLGMGDPSPASDAVVEDAELHAALLAAVEQLPDRQRAAVTLHVTQALTAAEIGDVLGMTAAAVLMTLSRARATLRTVLEKYRR